MHSMLESAIDTTAPVGDLGPRERRRLETSHALISLARRATAERGLHGFTIEEICAQAGISRRTFFNYFAGKEDAVVGIPLRGDDTDAEQRFLNGTGDLVYGLAELLTTRWATAQVTRASFAELHAAVEREPGLLAHIFEHSRREEEHHAALVAQREGLDPDDPRAISAATVIGHLSRVATGVFLSPENTDSFPAIFDRYLDTTRALFLRPTDHPSPPESTR